MITVLIVDDSSTQRMFIRGILESDPEIQVVGEAGSGEAAIEQVIRCQPNLITMDVNMPGMGGFEAIRHIMSESPRPIIVLTSIQTGQLSDVSFKALNLGALTMLPKPRGMPRDDLWARNLITQVKLMAGVKVVHREFKPGTKPLRNAPTLPVGARSRLPQVPIRLLAIGVSTGGPPALHTLLSGLAADFPAPIVVVQHISRGFVGGLAVWLSESTPIRCKVVVQNEIPQPGMLYFAPDDYHLTVKPSGLLWLSAAPPVNGLRPSANMLFESAAAAFGAAVVGVQLTGMGEDGAVGLLALRNAGAYTIAQDEASCVVYGMPKAAAEMGAVVEILPLDRIAARLQMLVGMPQSAQHPEKKD